jgi:hypothetical protein
MPYRSKIVPQFLEQAKVKIYEVIMIIYLLSEEEMNQGMVA